MTAGGGQRRHAEAGTPRSELTRLRAGRTALETSRREAIELAMLVACGERGYRSTSVQDALDRGAGNRSQFYKLFSGKAECFGAAYSSRAPRMVEAILAAGRRGPSWREGLRAALEELADRVEREPAPARALLVEVHVAGGEARSLRAALLARLAAAIDSARRVEGAREDPSALTARFMLGAVDAAACRALTLEDPGSFRDQVPELAQLIVDAYFGGETAAEELSSTAYSYGRLSPTS